MVKNSEENGYYICFILGILAVVFLGSRPLYEITDDLSQLLSNILLQLITIDHTHNRQKWWR